MEILLTPEVQAKLDQLAGETGRAQDEFVQDALAGYFDELAQVRGMLDSRYDDLEGGRVTWFRETRSWLTSMRRVLPGVHDGVRFSPRSPSGLG